MNPVKTIAVILAAGEGTRLRPYTLDRPKCLVELAGLPLISHQLAALEEAGIGEIHIVTGYRAEQLQKPGWRTIHNPEYARTNMVASFMRAAHLCDGLRDVLICYGDIVYEPRIIAALLATGAPLATTVDRRWLKLWQARSAEPLKDAETLRLDGGGNIVELGKKPRSLREIEGQYMGLILIRAAVAPKIIEIYRRMDRSALYDGKDFANMYMTAFLRHLIGQGLPLKAVPVEGGWLEIDTVGDLELFNRLHREGRLAEHYRVCSPR